VLDTAGFEIFLEDPIPDPEDNSFDILLLDSKQLTQGSSSLEQSQILSRADIDQD
jgi:hypothetical protein